VLPGGFRAGRHQIRFVREELERVRRFLERVSGMPLDDGALASGIREANEIRRLLRELRELAFTAPRAPIPALELLIAEMLAIHFCSHREESAYVLRGLVRRVKQRIAAGQGYFREDAARIFWVNPVADLRAMNILERCGGRLCGTDFMFAHALEEIPVMTEPLEALARMALADPMVGSARERAERICRDVQVYGSEGIVVSRIPGASHCALEGEVIADYVRTALGIPVIEIEIPPVSDALRPALESRLSALVEVIRRRRG
jgi:benzoyl-CoA reductase/2-hydroxyglutaryl-CoA dehydratase subunit BcrC/BadD/HgdB